MNAFQHNTSTHSHSFVTIVTRFPSNAKFKLARCRSRDVTHSFCKHTQAICSPYRIYSKKERSTFIIPLIRVIIYFIPLTWRNSHPNQTHKHYQAFPVIISIPENYVKALFFEMVSKTLSIACYQRLCQGYM